MTWTVIIDGALEPYSDVKTDIRADKLNEAEIVVPESVDPDALAPVELQLDGVTIFEGYITKQSRTKGYRRLYAIVRAWDLGKVIATPGWTKMKYVGVWNWVGKTLKDYPVRVDVTWDPNMAGDFSDVRFGDARHNVYSHFLESKIDWNWAIFWVRIPELLPGGNDMWMYFGRKGAQDVSSGRDTFPVWIDGESGSIPDYFIPVTYAYDHLEWSSDSYQGSRALYFSKSGASLGYLLIRAGYGHDVAIEAMCKGTSGTRLVACFDISEVASACKYEYLPDQGKIEKTGIIPPRTTLCSGLGRDIGYWRRWRLGLYGDKVVAGVDDYDLVCEDSKRCSDGYLGFCIYASELHADCIRVRPFVYPEPMVWFGSTQDISLGALKFCYTWHQVPAHEVVEELLPWPWQSAYGRGAPYAFEDTWLEEFTVTNETVLDALTKLARQYMKREIWFGPGTYVNIASTRPGEQEIERYNVLEDIEDHTDYCDGVIVIGQQGVYGSAGNLAGKVKFLRSYDIETEQDANAYAAKQLALYSRPVRRISVTSTLLPIREAEQVEVPGHSRYVVESVVHRLNELQIRMRRID